MNWPARVRNLFLFASYFALSVAPFLPMLLWGRSMPHAGQLLGLQLLLWAALWAVFGQPANFHWLLLPAFLALPFEIYLLVFFGQGLSAHHLGIMAETTSGEALEFMGSRAWLMLAVLVAVAMWWVLAFVAARHTEGLAWRGKTRCGFLLLVGTLVGAAAYAHEFGIAGARQQEGTTWEAPEAGAHTLGISAMPPLPHVAQLIHSVDLSQTRPFGLIAQVVDYFNERAQLAKLTQGAQNFSFQAHQRQPDGAPEVVVMVLGESSRFDRWSLNGYARDTTPLLAKESNLLALSDVVTPVSITRQSVPIIVTRKPASAALTSGYHERSFVSAYKEAGFRTWWLSNQLTYGTHDTPVSAYSQEADHQAHLNPGGHTDQSSYDAALLEPLQRALAAPAPRKLVVLHTLGNHWNYGRRYPAQFDRWQPSLTDIDRPDLDNPAHRERASNSYDNSILYTDWFLAQVIGILKRQQQRAVLVFASDHGEVLADESCPKFLHGHGTQHELHVPAFVWYSDQYRTRYPDKIAELQRHRAERLGTPDFFHTLLDLGDIRYPGERLEWSFAQAAYTPRQRLVAAGGWADYDTAERKGTCLALAAK